VPLFCLKKLSDFAPELINCSTGANELNDFY